MATEMEDIFILFLISFFCGICSAIGWYLIYVGLEQFILKIKLKFKGNEGSAVVSKKWMTSNATDSGMKTVHIMTYRFMYEQKEYYIDHIVPDNETIIALHNLAKIERTIHIWFDPKNPMKSLPKIVETYPKIESVKKVIGGILVIIFNGAACFGLIVALEQNHNINLIIKIINLCLVIIGYPLLALFIRYTVCKSICAEDKTSKYAKSRELEEIQINNANTEKTPILNDNDHKLDFNILNKEEKEETEEEEASDEDNDVVVTAGNDEDENEEETAKVETAGNVQNDEFVVKGDDDNEDIPTDGQEQLAELIVDDEIEFQI